MDYNYLFSCLTKHWHWEEEGKTDLSAWTYIYLNYPEFRYQGPAFRAIFGDNSSEESKNNHKSWSMTMEGINHFLVHCFIDSLIEEDDIITVLESTIAGVNIFEIYKVLTEKGFTLENGYAQEKEIFAIEVLGPTSNSTLTGITHLLD